MYSSSLEQQFVMIWW